MIAILLAGSIATLISLFGTRYLIIFFRTRGGSAALLVVLRVGRDQSVTAHAAAHGATTLEQWEHVDDGLPAMHTERFGL